MYGVEVTLMKAVVWTRYGGPEGLEYREVDKPIIKSNEVLIKVAAASVFAGDCEIRALKINPLFILPMRLFFGALRPRDIILGQEFSGVIEAVGSEVKEFEVGQRVFGNTGFKFGAYAEYLALPVDTSDIIIESAPDNIPLEHAAGLVVGGIEALHFLNKVSIVEGTQILINGAGGSIGAAAIQIAKSRGAVVAAVDLGDKLEALTSLGADRVIDYRKLDFTSEAMKYDVVFDIVGKSKLIPTTRVLKTGGRYLFANPKLFMMFRSFAVRMITGVKVEFDISKPMRETLTYIKSEVEANRFRVYIDRIMPLSQMIEAHRYVDEGRKIGNLIITMKEEQNESDKL